MFVYYLIATHTRRVSLMRFIFLRAHKPKRYIIARHIIVEEFFGFLPKR